MRATEYYGTQNGLEICSKWTDSDQLGLQDVRDRGDLNESNLW